jgi:hypothetical protein
MVKFGLFDGGSENAKQEFEGEWLAVNGDIVCVMSKVSAVDRTLAVVRLTPDQSLKKIKD